MSKLYPDCIYLKKEDVKSAPYEECESCHNYDNCLVKKEARDTSTKRMIKNINEVFRESEE